MNLRKARELPDESVRKTHTIEGVEFDGYKAPHRRTPKQTPYRFNTAQLEELAIGIRIGLNVMLAGPTGCGKTSLPIQLAARLNQPCVRFNCDGETRVAHLRGQQRPAAQDGVLTLKFVMGLLAEAMREGWWVVLDELDAALPSVLFVLQSVLEEGNRALQIPETNEYIEAHPNFRLFATSNTIGYRSMMRARHAGTNMMNTAFIDRFGMIIDVDYPELKEEVERVRVHVPELAEDTERAGMDMITGICRVAEELRKDEKFRVDFSTRRCIQWARLVEQFPTTTWTKKNPNGELPFDMARTCDLAVLRKLESATDMKVAREMLGRVFGYDEEKPK